MVKASFQCFLNLSMYVGVVLLRKCLPEMTAERAASHCMEEFMIVSCFRRATERFIHWEQQSQLYTNGQRAVTDRTSAQSILEQTVQQNEM